MFAAAFNPAGLGGDDEVGRNAGVRRRGIRRKVRQHGNLPTPRPRARVALPGDEKNTDGEGRVVAALSGARLPSARNV